eukprot:835914-Rhodomonas_salina.1
MAQWVGLERRGRRGRAEKRGESTKSREGGREGEGVIEEGGGEEAREGVGVGTGGRGRGRSRGERKKEQRSDLSQALAVDGFAVNGNDGVSDADLVAQLRRASLEQRLFSKGSKQKSHHRSDAATQACCGVGPLFAASASLSSEIALKFAQGVLEITHLHLQSILLFFVPLEVCSNPNPCFVSLRNTLVQ